MSRKLVSIQKILNIEPIENADKIEKITVLGWHVVASKSENHKIGDLIAYVEIDTQLPNISMFEFLKDRKYRVRTIKLRGQVSQGLIIPLRELEKNFNIDISKLKEGDDITSLIGATKYDPEAEKENKLIEQEMNSNKSVLHKFLMKYEMYRKLYKHIQKPQKSGFPSWIRKTDEDRIQVLVDKFNEIIEKNNTNKPIRFDSTEKLDGQSATFFIKKDKILNIIPQYEFGVCSRNLRLKNPNKSSYWTVAYQYDIENVLKDILKKYSAKSVVLQGEICGNGIQGNKYKISGDGYYFATFNLIIDGIKYRTTEAQQILKPYKIDTVPILDTDVLLYPTIDKMVEDAEGKSRLYNKSEREGKVWRSTNGDISFKVINPKFLLKNNE